MEQFKLFPTYLFRLFLGVLIAIFIGTILLTAACIIPSGPMDDNLQESASIFGTEGIYPELYPWCTSQLDNTTDSLILLISAYDSGKSPLAQAMQGTRNTLSSTEAPSYQLALHYGENIPFDGAEPYYQYWHGYQILIRPILSLMNYGSIRVLNGCLQTILLILLCVLLYRKGMGRLILPYLASVAMLMPVALAKSLQFSSCYYILTLGSIAVLWKSDRLDHWDGSLFLFIGIATAYFDFLTYPVATLGIPAVFLFCVKNGESIRNIFCRGVKICFSWAVGYIGMWAGKWLVGSLILGQNILSIAADKVTERTAADSAHTGLLYNIRAALSANFRSFLHTPALALVAVLAVVFLFLLAKRLRSGNGRFAGMLTAVFPFAVLAILPPAWYAVTSQHAVIHYWFTNKALVVSVFACLAALAKISQKPE